MKKTNAILKLICSLCLFLSCFNIEAQEVTGAWKGNLKVQGVALPLVFKIEQTNGVYASTMDSPKQGAVGIPMDQTILEDRKLTISFKQAGIKYVAEVTKDEINGIFYQAGMEFPLVLTRTEVTKPGDQTLPSSEETFEKLIAYDNGAYKYSVEDYFETPTISGIQFSPKGNYLSYREKDEAGKKHVYVKNVTTGKITRAIEEGDELIRGYGWANDTRLLYVKDNGGDENYQLYAANLDGTNSKALTPFEGVKIKILDVLVDMPNDIIIGMNKDNKQIFEPYKLNIVTGDLEKLFETKEASSVVSSYMFDKKGQLKAYVTQENGIDYTVFYRTEIDKPFEEVIHINWKQSFFIVGFNYATPYEHDAYVLSNLDSNTKELILYDLAKKETIQKIYNNPVFDVGGFGVSKNRAYQLDYYSYVGEKAHVVPVSKYFKKLYKKFQNKFEDKSFSIAGVTEDENKYLLLVTTDKLYGTYYTYDKKTNTFTKMLDLMPQLHEADMAEMKPIHFISRDGLTIYGYLTIPGSIKQGQKVPLIVNPHGGPYGIRDYWGFNPEAQLFASRGYATLQINYRGSGGYGKAFLLKGNKQIGRKMLDDLEDGVAYAKTFDFIDGDKVAIYGASYGGLATLGSLIKSPNLYTCGVDYVGVSNLFTFFKSFPAYWKPMMGQVKEQWYNPDDEEEQKIMTEVSPALHVDKITKPLFVIQGANDPRVNIDESDQVVRNMRTRGLEVPYMVKYNEGHGFHHEENKVVMYKTMLGFLAKYLK